jgi:hypothetical protein
MDQQSVVFNNPGWKALAIGMNTTANCPQSLSVNNLLVDAPVNSANQLLLNWAGLRVPLLVRSNLSIGSRGSLASHYSVLQAANADIDGGSASFSDLATERFDRISLRSGARLNLIDGTMTSSNLTFYTATLTQSGGTHTAQNVNLPQVFSPSLGTLGLYFLQGGTLISQQLALGYVGYPFGADGYGIFLQSGGVHTNSGMNLYGFYSPFFTSRAGNYRLDGGLLVSSYVSVDGGSFLQNGGTNIIGELQATGGSYIEVSGGELITSNTTSAVDAYVDGRFVQTGGRQNVRGKLLIRGSYNGPEYELSGGDLVTSNIEIEGGTLNLSGSGVVSNAGVLFVSGYAGLDLLRANIVVNETTQTQYLGQLQISSGATVQMHYPFSQPTNATVVRFADSHALPWSGPLQISFWGGISGDHIFIGTNAQGLTPAQLAQIIFAGKNTNYPAKLLATGELVPAVPPTLGCVNLGGALVVSWPGGGYELVTSTNLAGPYSVVPGATSPTTNTCSEPQRYFRLRMSVP